MPPTSAVLVLVLVLVVAFSAKSRANAIAADPSPVFEAQVFVQETPPKPPSITMTTLEDDDWEDNTNANNSSQTFLADIGSSPMYVTTFLPPHEMPLCNHGDNHVEMLKKSSNKELRRIHPPGQRLAMLVGQQQGGDCSLDETVKVAQQIQNIIPGLRFLILNSDHGKVHDAMADTDFNSSRFTILLVSTKQLEVLQSIIMEARKESGMSPRLGHAEARGWTFSLVFYTATRQSSTRSDDHETATISRLLSLLLLLLLVCSIVALSFRWRYSALATNHRLKLEQERQQQRTVIKRKSFRQILIPLTGVVSIVLGSSVLSSGFYDVVLLTGGDEAALSTVKPKQLSSYVSINTTHTPPNLPLRLDGTEQYKDYEEDLVHSNGDPHSRTATVIAFSYDDASRSHKRFVGSLRRTGYQGHITVFHKTEGQDKVEGSYSTEKYYPKKNATIITLQETDCTHGFDSTVETNLICFDPHSDFKMHWARYPFARDWLRDCSTCIGPVMLANLEDTYFQRDPFEGLDISQGLYVFEERNFTTLQWTIRVPNFRCYGVDIGEKVRPMLASGITIGTRDAMLQYLDAMVDEMQYWIDNKKCLATGDKRLKDDEAVHNYLIHQKSHVLPRPIFSVGFRRGIVFEAGELGAMIWRRDEAIRQLKRPGERYLNVTGDPWLAPYLNLTDSEGFLLQVDNLTRSRVVHRAYRFGDAYSLWLSKFRKDWQ